jgi:hypothetical protein
MKDFIKSNWAWIGLCIVFLSGWISTCSNKNVTKHDTPTYKTVTNKKEAIQSASIPDTIVKKFTEIKTVTRYVDRIKIDTIEIHYKDSTPCVFSRSGEVKTKEYVFTYNSNQNGFKIDNMQLRDSFLIVTGTKRKWFLGKETNTIDISHTNKYISTYQVQHIEVVPKKKFYDTTLFKFGVGFVLGVTVTK